MNLIWILTNDQKSKNVTSKGVIHDQREVVKPHTPGKSNTESPTMEIRLLTESRGTRGHLLFRPPWFVPCHAHNPARETHCFSPGQRQVSLSVLCKKSIHQTHQKTTKSTKSPKQLGQFPTFLHKTSLIHWKTSLTYCKPVQSTELLK